MDADRRVNLQKRVHIEQIALAACRSVLPDSAPKELHWQAMDAAESAIAPRGGRPELSDDAMEVTARGVVADICRGAGLEPVTA
jgi:hypothetical protein